MAKIKQKISNQKLQKIKQQAHKARKIRKKNKNQKNADFKVARKRKLFWLICKKNSVPLLLLLFGTWLYLNGNNAKNTEAAENRLPMAASIIENKPTQDNTGAKKAPQANNGKQAQIKAEKVQKIEIQEQKMRLVLAEKPDKAKYSMASVGETAARSPDKPKWAEQIEKLVKNTPMQAMEEAISRREQKVAAFLLGIGMKESKYGIYSPKDSQGNDCYNYWGYRGGENPTKSGYSCFESPEQAVQIVGDRIAELISYGRDTPAEMIVWKCGYSCAGHDPYSVDKWIDDVAINYGKITGR